MDGAIEFLEDFRLFVGRNTNAIISYGQFYQLVIPDNDYADIDSRAGIFNRILYQVTQNIGICTGSAVTNGRSGGKAVEKATCFPDGI